MKIKNKKIIFYLALVFFLNNFSKGSLLYKINNGLIEYQKKNYEISKNYFIDYINSNPNDKDGYFWLGKSYRNIKKEQNKAQEYFKKAYEISKIDDNLDDINFIKKDAINLEDYFDMSVSYLENNDYKNASYYADMMIKIDPQSAGAYFIKAKIAYITADVNNAKIYIKKAIMFNPEIIKTNLAKSLEVTAPPKLDTKAYKYLGLSAYFDGDIELAIENYKKIISTDNSDLSAVNFLIDLYIKNNQINSAQNILNEVIKQNENNIELHLNQAKIYHIKNNRFLELEELNKTYEINPNNQNTLLALGNYHLNSNNFELSKKYFETLISVNDELYEGYFGYIYSLIKLNETNEVLVLIRKMKKLNEKSFEIPYLLGLYCLKQGDFTQSIEYFNQAINQKNNPYFYLDLAKVYYLLDNEVSSIENLNEANNELYNQELLNEIQEYYWKNYLKIALKTGDLTELLEFNQKNALDKSRIMYKYNLYVIYKLQGKEENYFKQLSLIKKIRPKEEKDYFDLAEIYFIEKDYKALRKILDIANKKFPKSDDLSILNLKYNLINKN